MRNEEAAAFRSGMYPAEGDAAYEPREIEEHMYAACLLTLGAGAKDYDHAKSHRQQVQDGMDYGRTIDKWWLANYFSHETAIAAVTEAYCFRRRFLKWCREK